MRWHRLGVIARKTVSVAILGAVLVAVPFGTAMAQMPSGDRALQPRVLTPAEYLMGDTSATAAGLLLPGTIASPTSAQQDSLYARALATVISARARFLFDLRTLGQSMAAQVDLRPRLSEWERIRANMTIPPEYLVPSAQERTQYELNIARSMYVPGVLLFPMGTGNLQVTFGDIAKVFGLEEDVSPRIRYVVDETIEVTIVVYSSSAVQVTTLFNGIQPPGAYEIVWNGRDDGNGTVSTGDYIAEVRLGSLKLMRKRIVWPPR